MIYFKFFQEYPTLNIILQLTLQKMNRKTMVSLCSKLILHRAIIPFFLKKGEILNWITEDFHNIGCHFHDVLPTINKLT